MEVGSVSSNASTYTNSTAQATQTAQVQQAKQVEQRQPQPAERVELKEEAPKPVTNTFGQKTGSVISVTA